jgi:hypothetical protein
MTRYGAKLLFQFRVTIDGSVGRRRICEEQIINFRARSPGDALRGAKRRGKQREFSYTNFDGNPVAFQFVGVLDLMELGISSDRDEVWYDFRDRLQPMERRDKIIPKDSDLLRPLKRNERARKRARKGHKSWLRKRGYISAPSAVG